MISAIINAQSRSFVRHLSPDLFLPAEQQAYQFFMQFYRRFSGLPTLDIMRQNGLVLLPAPAPPLTTWSV